MSDCPGNAEHSFGRANGAGPGQAARKQAPAPRSRRKGFTASTTLARAVSIATLRGMVTSIVVRNRLASIHA